MEREREGLRITGRRRKARQKEETLQEEGRKRGVRDGRVQQRRITGETQRKRK